MSSIEKKREVLLRGARQEHVVHGQLSQLLHRQRRVHLGLHVALAEDVRQRAQVLEVAVREQHGVDAGRDLEQLAQQRRVKGLIPAAVEQDARLVNLQQVAQGLLAARSAQGRELDEGRHGSPPGSTGGPAAAS
jgi:hypothetical protein